MLPRSAQAEFSKQLERRLVRHEREPAPRVVGVNRALPKKSTFSTHPAG
jgi:hypothetical protein